MAIEEIDIDLSPPAMPEAVARLVEASDRCWDEFFARKDNRRFPRLIPSDASLVFAAIHAVTQQNLAPGRVFCEWGSGFGTGVCIASLLGYEAYGIEIQDELVDLSREMAQSLDIPVDILCTSYIPDGYESYAGVGGEDLVVPEMFAYAGDEPEPQLCYDGMEIEIAGIDLFFVYPWPDEQEMMQQLFNAVAAEGAVLIAYHSAKEICVFQKSFDERDPSTAWI